MNIILVRQPYKLVALYTHQHPFLEYSSITRSSKEFAANCTYGLDIRAPCNGTSTKTRGQWPRTAPIIL